MDIVVSVNSKYVRYLYVMLVSLFDSNRGEGIRAFVLQRDLSGRDRQVLTEQAALYDCQIEFLAVEERLFASLPTSLKFPIEAYFRLLLPELLPQEVKKILYLDIDIIIRSGLKSLYETDINDVVAAVCLDMFRPALDAKRRKQFKREKDFRYFNSGVMLFNVHRLRQDYPFEVFMKAAREMEYDLQFADQEILNYLLFDQVKYLPAKKYNYLVMGDITEQDLNDDIVILHFAGCNPWQEGSKNDLYRIWWRHAKKTPFYTELLEEQLWRTEGLNSDGNAIGMREMEIKGIYEIAFSLKGRGRIRQWLDQRDRKICIYGAGAMAEVLYELLEYDDATDYALCIFDRSKKGNFHGIQIENKIKAFDDSIMVITPALKPHEIVRYIKNETEWNGEVLLLRKFLYKVIQ